MSEATAQHDPRDLHPVTGAVDPGWQERELAALPPETRISNALWEEYIRDRLVPMYMRATRDELAVSRIGVPEAVLVMWRALHGPDATMLGYPLVISSHPFDFVLEFAPNMAIARRAAEPGLMPTRKRHIRDYMHLLHGHSAFDRLTAEQRRGFNDVTGEWDRDEPPPKIQVTKEEVESLRENMVRNLNAMFDRVKYDEHGFTDRPVQFAFVYDREDRPTTYGSVIEVPVAEHWRFSRDWTEEEKDEYFAESSRP